MDAHEDHEEAYKYLPGWSEFVKARDEHARIRAEGWKRGLWICDDVQVPEGYHIAFIAEQRLNAERKRLAEEEKEAAKRRSWLARIKTFFREQYLED